MREENKERKKNNNQTKTDENDPNICWCVAAIEIVVNKQHTEEKRHTNNILNIYNLLCECFRLGFFSPLLFRHLSHRNSRNIMFIGDLKKSKDDKMRRTNTFLPLLKSFCFVHFLLAINRCKFFSNFSLVIQTIFLLLAQCAVCTLHTKKNVNTTQLFLSL